MRVVSAVNGATNPASAKLMKLYVKILAARVIYLLANI